jgi:hypothetical protein
MTERSEPTMSDDRITRYLTDRAATIDLPPSSAEAVVGRASRRRRSRRGAVAAVVALAVGTSAVFVTQRVQRAEQGEPTVDVAVEPAVVRVAPSPFDWAVAESTNGVSQFHGATAVTDDGAVYTLSTAPGALDQNAWSAPRTLYRSVDGTEWSPVALPDDFWAASLTGVGNQLFAVGTAPAGGAVTYRVARSDDGGGDWAVDEIPTPYAELKARYPGEVSVSAPVIAVHDGTVVVGMSLFANPNYADRVPGGLPPEAFVADVADEGIRVGHLCDVMGQASSPTTEAPVEAWADGDPSASGAPAAEQCREAEPEEGRAYTWAELGVDDELRDLTLHGRTSVYVAHDGGEFTPVNVGDATPMGGQIVATDDGFVGFSSRAPRPETLDEPPAYTTAVLRSADGVTWTPAGELNGYVSAAGAVGGQPAVALADTQGSQSIQLGRPDGSWFPVDPAQAVTFDDPFVSSVSFGPLGWAAVVSSPSNGGETQVVHSVDGTTMSPVPVADLVAPEQFGPLDTSVTADAVLVRVSERDDWDPETITRQRVVVGTPAS